MVIRFDGGPTFPPYAKDMAKQADGNRKVVREMLDAARITRQIEEWVKKDPKKAAELEYGLYIERSMRETENELEADQNAALKELQAEEEEINPQLGQ